GQRSGRGADDAAGAGVAAPPHRATPADRRRRRPVRLADARRREAGADQDRAAGGFLSDAGSDRAAAWRALTRDPADPQCSWSDSEVRKLVAARSDANFGI